MSEEKKPDPHPISLHEIDQEIKKRVSVIDQEFTDGFNLIKHQPKSVTFFGSARLSSGPHYDKARELAGHLADRGYSIVTGGGPGIMEAANRGAFERGGRSIGLNIKLPHEQHINAYITPAAHIKDPHTIKNLVVTHQMSFYYFFTRKVMLAFSAEAYVFFPGGFGTLDEFFEILTLVQTKKIDRVPLILIGTAFWQPLQDFIKSHLLEQFATVSPEDLNLYTITDDIEAALNVIQKVPVRNGIRLHFPVERSEQSAQ